jgi:prepilin-type N-terminal cleavage/methylation domain-containing protein
MHPIQRAGGRGRSAFTMIELLVVVSIIGLLLAITVGTVFRVRSSSQARDTEALVSKVNSGLDEQMKAAVDQARDDFINPSSAAANPLNSAYWSNVMNLAGGDMDRAKVLYVKMKVLREFPENFTEALTPAYNNYGVPPKPSYVSMLAGINAGPSPDTTLEGAVMLYMALQQTRRGMSFKAQDVAGNNGIGTINVRGKDFSVFMDVWGNPIRFVRWPTQGKIQTVSPQLYAEFNSPPYARPTDAKGNPLSMDPLDPSQNNAVRYLGTIYSGNPSWGSTAQGQFAANLIQGEPWVIQNLNPFVYSAGKDEIIGTGDDIYGFRLRKSERGD